MTETETNTQDLVQSLQLKIQALKERISLLVTDYEDKDSDKRVQITLLSNTNQQLDTKVKELEAQIAELQKSQVREDDAVQEKSSKKS